MKNKLPLLLFSALLLVLCISAGKNTFSGVRVKEVVNSSQIKDFQNYESAAKYFYTPDGKIASIVKTSDTAIYRYHDSVVIREEHRKFARSNSTDSMIIGPKGWIIKKFVGTGTFSRVFNFEYNEWGNRVGKSGYVTTDSDEYTFSNGNQTRLRRYAKGRLIITTYTSYFTDKPNNIDNENMGQSFLGKTSTNLVNEVVNVNEQTNYTDTTRYVYKFDTDGRVTEKYNYGRYIYQDNMSQLPMDTAIHLLNTTMYKYY